VTAHLNQVQLFKKDTLSVSWSTFGMWDCNPCATPLDAKSRSSKTDYPQVVDPSLHRRYHSITGCLSYLVNMTRPDLEFVYFSVEQVCTISGCGTSSGFGHPQKKPTEIWEDNASCIMISENATNRDRSTHVDVKVHYLRDLVRDDHVKLVKCAGTQNVSDDLTKSLARPSFEKHREHVGNSCPFFSFL
jgi:hypothetical protein